MPGDLVGDEGGPRDLDHGAELVGDRNALPLHDALRLRFERLPLDPQLLREADQRDHDFRPDIDAFPLEATCRLEDRADLHPGDLGKHDAEATAPKSEHRVGLAGELDGFEETLLPRQERLDPSSEIRAAGLPGFREERPVLLGGCGADERLGVLARDSQLRHLDEQGLVPRQELMERRIDQADDHGESGHFPQDSDEVVPLHLADALEGSEVPPREILEARVEFGEPPLEVAPPIARGGVQLACHRLALPPGLPVRRGGKDHLVDDRQSIGFHEHVFRAVEADALGAKLPRPRRVSRIVGVRPHLQRPFLVGPAEQGLQIGLSLEVRGDRPNRSREDLARAAVDREMFAATNDLVPDAEFGRVVVDLDCLAAGNARDAEAPGHDGRMARGTATRGEDAFRMKDSMYVVRGGLDPHEDDRLSLAPADPLGLVGIEGHDAHRGTGGRVQAYRE